MKILVVLPRFPYPLEKGDKLRAYHQIKGLHALGHEIHLFCVSHATVSEADKAQLRPYCATIHVVHLSKVDSGLHAFGEFCRVRNLQGAFWSAQKAKKAFRKVEHAVRPDVIYNQMVRTMPLVLHSRVPKVMDFQDCLSLNMLRNMQHYELSLPQHGGKAHHHTGKKKNKVSTYYRHSTSLRYFVYHYEFKTLRSMEAEALRKFHALTIISEPDRQALPVRERERVQLVPNGVDFDYFTPRPDAEKHYDIAFCGNMQYKPNVLTAIYLVEQVMPLVWQEMPQATLLLAGATPTAAVSALAEPRVCVSGTVPDIRDCYAGARVFAAPMQAGSGLQNKLLEAMAMEIPCVTSSLANAALGAKSGSEILVGDTSQEVAQHILTLLRSRQQCDILVDNARRFVRDAFTWSATSQRLESILKRVVDGNVATKDWIE